jgi:glutamate-1-semialdehyde 2,1-aminomutase
MTRPVSGSFTSSDPAMSTRIPGFTSTGSKRPDALFGGEEAGLPRRMVRASGCHVWDEAGARYTDYIMGLGAVALGYAHPAVSVAAHAATDAGVVGPLPPVIEEILAERICRLMPHVESLRFLKTGAEAMAAAVRIARTHTGREHVIGCGYHGWLDWSQPAGTPGVPAGAAVSGIIPFNDPERGRAVIRAAGNSLAAVAFEPVVLEEPSGEWLEMLRSETRRAGAVLIVDEIKTAGRVAIGGATERYALEPDLVVMGKAIANGFPLAVVGGRQDIMRAATRTWISSTLATEFVSLAAADATLDVMVREEVTAHLGRIGGRLYGGLRELAARHHRTVVRAAGIPEMCLLELNDRRSALLAGGAARRGILWKRSAYNFVSLAHDEPAVDATLAVLDEVLTGLD